MFNVSGVTSGFLFPPLPLAHSYIYFWKKHDYPTPTGNAKLLTLTPPTLSSINVHFFPTIASTAAPTPKSIERIEKANPEPLPSSANSIQQTKDDKSAPL